MMNYNIATLFGGMKTGSFSAINFSNYASIKNGSYKKLVKSYYSQQADSPIKTNNKTEKKETLKTNSDSSGLAKMKTEADELKSATKDLENPDLWKQKNGSYDKEKIVDAIKKFAKEYNGTIDQSSKVTSKDVTQQTGYMKSMTNTMSKVLSNVGVNVECDGKLTVNEDALKNADIKDLKATFSGSYSYASQIEKNAGAISSAATRNASLYSSAGLLTSTMTNTFNDWI